MWRNRIIIAILALALSAAPSFAQTGSNVLPQVVNGLDSNGGMKLAPVGNGTGGSVPLPVTGAGGTSSAPYQFTWISSQSFSTATLATSHALTIPSGTLRIDIYPECTTGGKDGVCVRFNPGGTADSSASPPIGASLQFYLGESGSLFSAAQFILDATATGPTGTTPALTAVYSK